jgi:hypothetical protein
MDSMLAPLPFDTEVLQPPNNVLPIIVMMVMLMIVMI